MAFKSTAVTVATTATVVYTAPKNGVATAQPVLVVNNSSSTVYVGGSDVTTANGVPVAANASLSVDVVDGDVLYGIVASGTADVRVLRSRA